MLRRKAALSTCALAIGACILWHFARCPSSQTTPNRTPARTLPAGALVALDQIAVAAGPTGARLVGRGTTGLPDGARLQVEVGVLEALVSFRVECRCGAFGFEEPLAGLVTNGTYRVTVLYRLEDQTSEVQRALGYRGRRLTLDVPLVVRHQEDAARELLPRFRGVAATACRATDRAALEAAAREALALERALGLSKLQPAARRLREAIEKELQASEPSTAAARERAFLACEALASL